MRKIIASLVLGTLLFAGGSAAYEYAYCRGAGQGIVIGVSIFMGRPSEEAELVDIVAESCMQTPNAGGITTGNAFDKAVDTVRNWLPF